MKCEGIERRKEADQKLKIGKLSKTCLWNECYMVQDCISIFLLLWATYNVQLILRIASTKLSQLLVTFNIHIQTTHPNGLKSAYNFATGTLIFVVVMTTKKNEIWFVFDRASSMKVK